MLVEVYRNLHKACWSIRDVKTRKVIEHAECFSLQNATFRVQKGGQTRARQSRVRNVHAWVRGKPHKGRPPKDTAACRITYNPFKDETFRVHIGTFVRDVREVSYVTFTEEGVCWAWI